MDVTRDPAARARRRGARRSRASWRGRSPTTSRAGRRCGSARCCTTPASRPRARSPTRGACCSGATTAWARTSRAPSCRRMHASTALGDFLAALAQHHLRLGLPRARAAAVAAPRVPLHARVRAGRGRGDGAVGGGPARDAGPADAARRRSRSHLDAGARAGRARRSPGARGDRPRAPVRGDELIAELGIEPGPEVGRLLEAIDEAAFAGEVSTREEALALARRTAGSAAASSAAATYRQCRNDLTQPALVEPPHDALAQAHAVGERVVVDVLRRVGAPVVVRRAPCSRSPIRGTRTGSPA